MRSNPLLRLLLLAPAVLVLACVVETDRTLYAPGDAGKGFFRNALPSTAYLDGCSLYSYQRFSVEGWRDRGPGVVCVWEGFARPVEPGSVLPFEFRVPDEVGFWRLRVEVGEGCLADHPLGPETCRELFFVDSEPFEVRALCEPRECGPPLGMPNLGMPNRLCSDGETVAGPTDRCLRDVATGVCGWEITVCPEDDPS